MILNIHICNYSHKKWKNSLETRAVLLFLHELLEKYLGWPYREHIKTAINGGFCEKLLSENDFEAVLFFCYYDYGANASEAVHKIATDQRDYHKCFV